MVEAGEGGEGQRMVGEVEGGVEDKIEVGEIHEGEEETEAEIEGEKGMLRLYQHEHHLIDREEVIQGEEAVQLDYRRDQRLIYPKELEEERIECRSMLLKRLLSHLLSDLVNLLLLEEAKLQHHRNLQIKVRFLNIDQILVLPNHPFPLLRKVTTLKCLMPIKQLLTPNNNRVTTEHLHQCIPLPNLITLLLLLSLILPLRVRQEELILLINPQQLSLLLLLNKQRLQ